jgi:hypothetical protein
MTPKPRLTTRPGKTLAAVALLGALVACGSTDPSGTTPGSPTHTTPTHSTATMSPPHDFAAAKQVTVMQSGGLKPESKIFVFARDEPAPDGFTRADVADVLRAAADPSLKTPPATPRDTCCDRFMYRISISYPDGTSTTFVTVEGAPMTPAVRHLLSLAT